MTSSTAELFVWWLAAMKHKWRQAWQGHFSTHWTNVSMIDHRQPTQTTMSQGTLSMTWHWRSWMELVRTSALKRLCCGQQTIDHIGMMPDKKRYTIIFCVWIQHLHICCCTEWSTCGVPERCPFETHDHLRQPQHPPFLFLNNVGIIGLTVRGATVCYY